MAEDLNKDQKVAETFISGITTEKAVMINL